nr:uncharacterized protein CI109_000454 [Kwoniella shandongensis]KAA5530884.1 hypothetical protein CI109_000454 [Kwoniella shandongensis]
MLPPTPTRTTQIYLLVLLLAISLVTLAHFHPATSFSLPLLPTPDDGAVYGAVKSYPTYSRESDNRHLTQDECTNRFPDLYREADRAQRLYKKRGGITKEMVEEAEKDNGNARLVILNNKLFVKTYKGGINTRTQAAMAQVHRTVMTSPEPLPDIEFVIQTSDAGNGKYPHFALDREAEQEEIWLMPDFGFYSWPEPGVGAYTEVRAKALAYEQNLGLRLDDELNVIHSSWENKTEKLFWRGSPMVEVRQDLLRASRDQPWSDVKELNWGAVNKDEEEKMKNNGDLRTPAEHCQYQFLAHVEGWAYSGRLKYLQQCRSVIVAHPLKYIQHYHHLLNSNENDPNQNIVEVPLPLEENLPGVMEKLLDPMNREKVERIADNSWRQLREGWISPAANECYYRYALRAYASVQKFQPSLENRAVPYESFLLMGSTHWDPH